MYITLYLCFYYDPVFHFKPLVEIERNVRNKV